MRISDWSSDVCSSDRGAFVDEEGQGIRAEAAAVGEWGLVRGADALRIYVAVPDQVGAGEGLRHLAAVEREAIEVIPEIGHVEADIEVVQPVGQLYVAAVGVVGIAGGQAGADGDPVAGGPRDRKSTRLNSSH